MYLIKVFLGSQSHFKIICASTSETCLNRTSYKLKDLQGSKYMDINMHRFLVTVDLFRVLLWQVVFALFSK